MALTRRSRIGPGGNDGAHALERLPTPGARECLGRVGVWLAEVAIHTPEGATWHTRPELLPAHQRTQCRDGQYNLGVAHGVPAVLAVLELAVAAGVARPRAAPLATAAVDWLRAQRLEDTAQSLLPYWRNVDGSPSRPARTAWCYGDPGAGVAVLVAARALDVPAGKVEAIGRVRAAALRAPEGLGRHRRVAVPRQRRLGARVQPGVAGDRGRAA